MTLHDLDDLAGPGDLAKEHGFDGSVFSYWLTLPTFPQPLKVLSNGNVFSRAAVAAWIEETGRKPYGPRRRFMAKRRADTLDWVVWDHEARVAISGPYATRRLARLVADKREYALTK